MEISLIGINNTVSNIKQRCSVNFGSFYNPFKMNVNCLIVSIISECIPAENLNINFEIPPHVKLADPSFAVSGNVDMLLGADVFYRLLCVGQIPLGNGELLLQKTRLGWIVTGSLSINSKKQVECKLIFLIL